MGDFATKTDKRTGLVVSDLHLGQTRATGVRELRTLRDEIRASKPELIVLNGDIIDGKDTYGDRDQILDRFRAAIGEIRKTVDSARRANPDAKVVFVFGNHDSYHEVRHAMESLQKEFPDNLQVEEVFFRTKDTLFMHGDLSFQLGHYESEKDIFKAAIKGKLEFRQGILSRDPEKNPAKASHWKPLPERTGAKAVFKRVKGTVYSAVDSVTSGMFCPLDQVLEATRKTLADYDASASEDEKLLPGLKRIAIGHIHPPHGKTRYSDGELELIVTGASTLISKPTMYKFDVTDQGLENFQTFGQDKGRGR